jgi:hypothetical protein
MKISYGLPLEERWELTIEKIVQFKIMLWLVCCSAKTMLMMQLGDQYVVLTLMIKETKVDDEVNLV